MKQVSQLDQDGYFVGVTTADPSPLEQDVYLLPGGCIDEPAPTIPEGQRAKWDNGQWVFEDIPPEKPEQPYPSWTYDEETNTYVPPVPQPEPDYIWYEDEQAWYSPLENARRLASLSRADFKLGLLDMGELDAVKASMADPDTDPRVVILWEDAARFDRMHPDLLSFAQVMGYTDEQMDALFGIGANAININTATAEELESLSGVGAGLAQQIIDGRPWATIDDLANISGISQGMVDSWEITV